MKATYVANGKNGLDNRKVFKLTMWFQVCTLLLIILFSYANSPY